MGCFIFRYSWRNHWERGEATMNLMMDVVNSPFVGVIWFCSSVCNNDNVSASLLSYWLIFFRTSIEKYSYFPSLESKNHWTNNMSLQCSYFYNAGGRNPACINYPPWGNTRVCWWIAFLDKFYYEDEPQHNERGVSFSIARFRIILKYIL